MYYASLLQWWHLVMILVRTNHPCLGVGYHSWYQSHDGYNTSCTILFLKTAVRICLDAHCDRTTSEMRGLSPKIISGDSRRSENAQTHTNTHTIPNMKFKLKLLQIKCHVLGFTKDKAQNVLQKIIRVFAEAFVSHDRHTLYALKESEPPRTTYTCESQ
jgi:hypothetical protein